MMADVIPFIIAFILTAVVVVVSRNQLLRWARFTLVAFLEIIVFFATATAILRRVGN